MIAIIIELKIPTRPALSVEGTWLLMLLQLPVRAKLDIISFLYWQRIFWSFRRNWVLGFCATCSVKSLVEK